MEVEEKKLTGGVKVSAVPSEARGAKRQHLETTQYQTSAEFLQYLVRAKAESLLLPENRIYVCRRDEKIMNVWRGLIEHNFLSCPVLTITDRHAQEGGHYYGFIDLMDVVRYIAQHFDIGKIQREEMKWFDIVFEQKEWQDKTVAQVMSETPAIYSRRNPWHPVLRGYSLFSAFETLARQRGVNRVPIIDTDNHLKTMVTQTQLLNVVVQWMDSLGGVKDKPMNTCPQLFKTVVCVKATDSAMSAFNMMVDKDIVGVGVIDEAGRLTGNISVRDLRAISNTTNLWWRLMMKCSAYISLLGQSGLVSVKSDATIQQVCRLIQQKRVHRAYICDDSGMPIGIVSIKDLLLEILESM